MKQPLYLKKKKPFYTKKQFWTIIVGGFFIILMALSAVNIGSQNQDDPNINTIEYNDVEFTSTNLGWEAEVGGNIIILTYNPENLANVVLEPINLVTLNAYEKVYLSVNPEESVNVALRDFQTNFPIRGQYVVSCYEDSEPCVELPLKTCEDATNSVGVVIFREAEESQVSFENNCFTIEGQDLLRVTDKLVLDYYGV